MAIRAAGLSDMAIRKIKKTPTVSGYSRAESHMKEALHIWEETLATERAGEREACAKVAEGVLESLSRAKLEAEGLTDPRDIILLHAAEAAVRDVIKGIRARGTEGVKAMNAGALVA
jgi:hypothetical protein